MEAQAEKQTRFSLLRWSPRGVLSYFRRNRSHTLVLLVFILFQLLLVVRFGFGQVRQVTLYSRIPAVW